MCTDIADIRDVCLIPGLGRSPGGEQGNPLQYSCLENAMDRGVWQATIHSITNSRSGLKQLSTQAMEKIMYLKSKQKV